MESIWWEIANQNSNEHVGRKNYKKKSINKWIGSFKLCNLNQQLEKIK